MELIGSVVAGSNIHRPSSRTCRKCQDPMRISPKPDRPDPPAFVQPFPKWSLPIDLFDAADFLVKNIIQGDPKGAQAHEKGIVELARLCDVFSISDIQTNSNDLDRLIHRTIQFLELAGPAFDPVTFPKAVIRRWFASFSKTVIFVGPRPLELNEELNGNEDNKKAALAYFAKKESANWKIQRGMLAWKLQSLRKAIQEEDGDELNPVLDEGAKLIDPYALTQADLDDFLQDFYGRKRYRNDVEDRFSPGRSSFEFFLWFVMDQEFRWGKGSWLQKRIASAKREESAVEDYADSLPAEPGAHFLPVMSLLPDSHLGKCIKEFVDGLSDEDRILVNLRLMHEKPVPYERIAEKLGEDPTDTRKLNNLRTRKRRLKCRLRRLVAEHILGELSQEDRFLVESRLVANPPLPWETVATKLNLDWTDDNFFSLLGRVQRLKVRLRVYLEGL